MVQKPNKPEPATGDVQIWYDQYMAMGLDKTPFDSTEDDLIINSLNQAWTIQICYTHFSTVEQTSNMHSTAHFMSRHARI